MPEDPLATTAAADAAHATAPGSTSPAAPAPGRVPETLVAGPGHCDPPPPPPHPPRDADTSAAAPSPSLASASLKRPRSPDPRLPRSAKEPRSSASPPRTPRLPSTSSLTTLSASPPSATVHSSLHPPHHSSASTQEGSAVIQTAVVRSSQSPECEDDLISEGEAARYGATRDHPITFDSSSDFSDDDSSSDSSAVSLTEALRTSKSAPLRSASTVGASPASARKFNAIPGLGGGAAKDGLKQKKLAAANHKFSLSKLVQQSERDSLTASELTKARQATERDDEEISVAHPPAEAFDRDLMATVVDNDGGDTEAVDKVLRAVGRTEADLSEPEWFFFDAGLGERVSSDVLPDSDIHSPGALSEGASRQGFYTGFSQDWAERYGLDPHWPALGQPLFESSILEPDAYLREAYGQAIRRQREPHEIISPDRLIAVLESAGARPMALDSSAALHPMTVGRHGEQIKLAGKQRQRVHSFLLVQTSACAKYSAETRALCLKLLFRMCVDYAIGRDCEIKMALQDAIVAVLGSLDPPTVAQTLRDIATWIFQTVTDQSLQLQFITNVPSFDRHVHLLRKRLALAFLLGDEEVLKFSEAGGKNGDEICRIIKHVQSSPQFSNNQGPGTNYSALLTAVRLLDMAIDGSPAHLSEPAPVAHGGGDSTAQLEARKDAEASFNGRVDELCSCIGRLQRRLVDGGGAIMARTEAKSALERLAHRLEHDVRTKARKKLAPIGELSGRMGIGDARSARLLSSYFQSGSQAEDPVSTEA